ncbi:MAG: TonB family protein [Acidobacteria bacterium]|nr:TonB family protein [Acidobacteriota bacterium]
MYFDFEDRGWDISSINRALSWREGILLSIIVHLVLILVIVLKPDWALTGMTPEEIAQQVELKRQRDRDAAQRFVFVQPRQDVEALKPPPTPDLSDKNRMARAPERSPNPSNPLPFSRGNTPEQVDSPATPPPPQTADQNQGGRDQRTGQSKPGPEGDQGGSSLILPGPPEAAPRGSSGRPGGLQGTIGDALRNLQRYTQGERFENPQGGAGAFGPAIQFDTKGVEFGPWVRRFVAQIKRNWFIPYAAMAMRGHVVITFNVHKDGALTDLTLVGPCNVDSFNNAAFNALVTSNPTYPLPPEYPAPRAFFTVTFYYNEEPPR